MKETKEKINSSIEELKMNCQLHHSQNIKNQNEKEIKQKIENPKLLLRNSC